MSEAASTVTKAQSFQVPAIVDGLHLRANRRGRFPNKRTDTALKLG